MEIKEDETSYTVVNEPLKKFKDVVVVINRLTTAEEIKEYNKHFRKYGLKKISMSYTEKSEQVII